MTRHDGLAVVHVVDSLELGGLERVVTNLAIEQSARGYRVCVFSINPTSGFRTELEQSGIQVVIGGKRHAFDLQVLRKLRATVRERGATIVHTHNFVPSYYAALAMVGTSGGVLVNTCHNMGTRLSNTRLRLLYRWSLRRTRRIAMVSHQVCEHLLALGIVPAEITEVVSNGIPLGHARATPASRQVARDALGIEAGSLLIGSVGRLVGLKNHRLLIEQMPSLLPRFPNLRMVLIGGGPLEQELRELAISLGMADRVMLTGPRSDVAALLSAFDVFVLPSLTEGLSIALLEACSAGLAIAASDVGGNSEIVLDGTTGRLFPPADASALLSVLGELLADAGLRARLGRAAHEWVQASGSIGAMQDRYEAFYRRATGRVSAGARRAT
jgi:glycosyltransferase involved in cell wall biosynthesis